MPRFKMARLRQNLGRFSIKILELASLQSIRIITKQLFCGSRILNYEHMNDHVFLLCVCVCLCVVVISVWSSSLIVFQSSIQ